MKRRSRVERKKEGQGRTENEERGSVAKRKEGGKEPERSCNAVKSIVGSDNNLLCSPDQKKVHCPSVVCAWHVCVSCLLSGGQVVVFIPYQTPPSYLCMWQRAMS